MKLVFEFAVANLSLLVALYIAGVDGAILFVQITERVTCEIIARTN